jgi:uncharacterized protein (DUF58 family)
LIYPSGRAAVLAAAAAVPAFAVAVALPQFWYAGLIGVVFVIALTAVDAAAAAPRRSMNAQLTAPSGAFVGQDVAIAITATPLSRCVKARVGHDERLTPVKVPSAVDDGVLALTYAAVRRGTSILDTLWVRWAGPFGLIWRQQQVPLNYSVDIVPDVRPARTEALRLFRRDMPIGETVQLDVGTGAEFQALAEYRTGMDRRAIDWKRSAHHGTLLAKEFRIERNNDIVFAIDGGRLMSEPVGGLPKVDRAVSAALSAAFVALKLGDKVSLFGFDSRPRVASGSVSGAGSFGIFQQLAAKIDYSSEETNYTFALTTLGARLVRRSLVLVFTDLADPTSAELMLRSIQQLAQKHLILFVLMRDVELEELVAAAPDDAADVSRAVVAASLLRERKIVIARLQRLGVHVVEAPHERLGTDLVNAYLDLKKRDLL